MFERLFSNRVRHVSQPLAESWPWIDVEPLAARRWKTVGLMCVLMSRVKIDCYDHMLLQTAHSKT